VRRLWLLCALALAGCGGDGSGGGDRLSAREFRDQANAICADLAADLEALGEGDTVPELTEQLEQGRERFEEALADLRDLQPPEDLEEDYDRLLETGDDAVELIDQMQQAAEDEDFEEVQRIAEEGEQQDEASDEIARDLGLDECATA
jgi:hypothetical protein